MKGACPCPRTTQRQAKLHHEVHCKEKTTYGNIVEGLLEGEGHTAADDERVDLVQHVLNQLNLVRDLGTTQDSQEGALWVLQGFGEVVELFLHEEAGCTLLQLHADHTGVRTVCGTESVIDVYVAELRQALAERLDLRWVCLRLLSVLVLRGALLLDVEPQVLEEDERALGSLGDGLLDLGANDSWTKVTGLPICFSSSCETGSREYLATTLPSGRPRWDIKMTLEAPGATNKIPPSVGCPRTHRYPKHT